MTDKPTVTVPGKVELIIESIHPDEPEKAQLVKLRFFAGLSIEEAAEALGISRATASRHWTYARAWLHDAISAD